MVGMIDVYHITDGHARVAEIDGNTAVSQHPLEWSKTPWTAEDAAAARAEMKKRYDEAEAAGRPLPSPPPPEPAPPTPEEKAAIEEHARAVSEAKQRLEAFYARRTKEKEEADQVARDEALVNSPPPQPDPAARRPFGRKGEPTEAEKAMMDKSAKEKAEADRKIKAGETSPTPKTPLTYGQEKTPQQIAAEKAEADKLGPAKADKHK